MKTFFEYQLLNVTDATVFETDLKLGFVRIKRVLKNEYSKSRFFNSFLFLQKRKKKFGEDFFKVIIYNTNKGKIWH